MTVRTLIPDFQLANPVYKNATVTFLLAVNGVATDILATIYGGFQSSEVLPNPQKLDSRGKQKQPIYVADSVIARISGGGFPPHDTGIISNPELESIWKLLAINTGGGTTYDFVNLTGFTSYVFLVQSLRPGTDSTDLWMRLSSNNGASYAALGDYEWTVEKSLSASSVLVGNGGDNQMKLATIVTSSGLAQAGGYSGVVETISDFSNPNRPKVIKADGVMRNTSFNAVIVRAMGTLFADAVAMNAARFMFSSGDIADGTIKCYGVN